MRFSKTKKLGSQDAIVALIFIACTFMALYVGSLREIRQQQSVILEMRDVMSGGQLREVERRLESRANAGG